MTVLDPMCGAGTILAESIDVARKRSKAGRVRVIGGDIDPNAVFVASQNLEKVGPVDLARWDARALPLESESVDRIISNPPFGKQLESIEKIGPLIEAAAAEWDRVLRPGGRAVLLAMEQEGLKRVLLAKKWSPSRSLRLRLLGQLCVLSVWNKPG
jgi:tRNA G10  N-methylase Trm11